jgi:uncharacterized protein
MGGDLLGLTTDHGLPLSVRGTPDYRRARQKVIVFLAFVTVFAGAVSCLRVFVPFGAKLSILTWTPRFADGLEMWSVGLAGLIALALIDGSLSDIGLRLGPAKYLLVAVAVPVAICAAIYVPVWILGVGTFAGVSVLWEGCKSALFRLPVGLFFAAGEEFGWRGVLVPNLARTAGWKQVVFLPGAIWAIWHYPDILLFDYNVGTPAIFALSCFSISLIGLGAILSWLRLASSSIWPSVLFHGVHNLVIAGIFDRATARSGATPYVATEFGAGLSVAAVAVGYVCWARTQFAGGEQPRGSSDVTGPGR